jgi:hypothetical protein
VRWPLALLIVFTAARARADGAFPDSLQLFTPADAPSRILLATNFGLLISENGGAHWDWVCEQAIVTGARLYSRGPGGRIFAVAPLALVSSADTCTWTVATGALGGGYVGDAFPDPNDAMHVLAIGTPAADGYAPPVLWESRDGGGTFQPPRYTAERGLVLSGVEVPRGQPGVVYLTAYDYSSSSLPHPYLLRSTDGGTTFTPRDLSPALGMQAVRLIAVDPDDAEKVYLRVTGTSGDVLAIADAVGVRIALTVSGTMTAFLRRADGRIFLGTASAAGFISTDGGQTFMAWPHTPHLHALSERGGMLYAAGDNFADGFAVAVSSDDGVSWRPLLSFDHICGPLACGQVPSTCAGPWATLVGTFQIPPNVCSAGGGTGGSAGAGGSSGGGGCGCRIAAGGGGTLLAALAALTTALARRRRCARPGAPARSRPSS